MFAFNYKIVIFYVLAPLSKELFLKNMISFLVMQFLKSVMTE